MKAEHKAILKEIIIVLTLGIAVYVVYSIYKAFQAGVRDVKGLLTAPFTALSNAYNTVTGGVAAVASLPALQQQNQLLDQQLTTMNTNDYAPGGSTYNLIAASQGQAAADAAWAQVQKNLATQESQDSTLSIWNPFNW